MGNLNEVIQNCANQFDETDASEFQATTEFRQLDEWSSLMALSIIAMVDEEYNVQLKGDDIVKSQTIDDLFRIVSSKTI